MPMSPRLLRPRQTIHPEAADWANRVRTNGGSVSGTTLNAVDRFVKAIHAAGIRDRFYRLNLFCGNSDANLAAVRTPLYRGPSLTGTQYGNATDTNVNFVQGDYSENEGLRATANGSQSATKYLDTGFAFASLPSYLNAHMAADYKTLSGSSITSGQWIMGGLVDTAPGSPQTNQYRMLATTPTSSGYNESLITGGTLEAVRANQTIGSRFHAIVTRSSATSLTNYRDGASPVNATSAISTTLGVNPACQLRVFGLDNQGVASASFRHIISQYSIGLSLTDAQASAYFAAVSSLRTALGRT